MVLMKQVLRLCVVKKMHCILVEGDGREGLNKVTAFITECLQTSALGHENVACVLRVYNPCGGSRLPVLYNYGEDTWDPYIIGGKVHKYSNI